MADDINQFIVNNHKYLKGVAGRITGRDSSRYRDDLLQMLYEHLLTNDMSEVNNLQAWSVSWLKNNFVLPNPYNKTSFAYLFKRFNQHRSDIDDLEEECQDQDSTLHLLAEDAPQSAVEYVNDLKTTGYSDEQIERILFCKIIRHEFPLHIRNLYDMYFNEGMTARDIHKKTGIPYTAVLAMVNGIKKTIKDRWDSRK